MKRMVAGLLISKARRSVALVSKLRPEWQKGRLNGIGGHIEEGESPVEAMIREFQEEAGATVTCWQPFCTLSGKDWEVKWFKAFDDARIKTITDEKVEWYSIDQVVNAHESWVIPNVRWLLLMALEDGVTAQVNDPFVP